MAKIVTTGLDETLKWIQKTSTELDATARVIAAQSALLIEAQAKRNFIGSHAKGQSHVGGGNPNVVTGYLRRSIQSTTPKRVGLGAYEVTVGPTAIYGRRIELGYVGGGGRGHQATRAFPFLDPAVTSTEMQRHALAVAKWRAVLG